MTHIIDELDRAAALSEAHNTACVQKVQRDARPQQVRNADGTWPITECIECEEPIPLARLEHGRTKCVECQTVEEQKRKLHAP